MGVTAALEGAFAPTHARASAGARNLLENAAQIRAGDQLLLLVEPQGAGHYDDDMGRFLAAQAEALGASARVLEVPVTLDIDDTPAWIMDAIAAADQTIFLARIGDQLRFHPLPGPGRKVMSYAFDFDLLSAPFATTPFAVMRGLHDHIAGKISRASSCTLTCPRGTHLTTRLRPKPISAPLDFTVATFPVMIVAPIPAAEASGQLVLSQALTSTYILPYEGSILPLPEPLTLSVEQGEITGFSGPAPVVEQARAQFARVHRLLGGPELRVGSWHAGINPMTFFPRPAMSDIDRWSGLAFGSPRYAHIHMGGPAPGQICGQIFDPTISLDGEEIWRDGRLIISDTSPDSPDENGDIADLLSRHGLSAADFATRQDIGVTGLPLP